MQQKAFFLLAVRHSLKHPIQSLLLILGIALGVAMIVAIDLANSSASRAFALSTDSLVGKATHQIVAEPGNLPTSVYTQLRREVGLTDVAPTVTGLVLLQNADDLPLQLLGVDPFAEAPFRAYLGDGEGNLSFEALLSLLLEPNTVVVSQSLSDDYNLRIGDTLSLMTGGAVKTVELVGILQPTDETSRQAINGMLLADISTAQEVLDSVGRLSTIDLILDSGMDTQPILDILPPNAQLQPASLRTQTLSQMTEAFELNLSAMSLLALVVGMFLIYNTINFSVVQRRPVLGTLRCLGVTRNEIFGLVITEALVLSTVGALIGLGLGILLGRGLVGLVTQTINDLFFTTTVQSVVVTPWTLYKGFVAGVMAGGLAAFVPALEATTVPPNSALKRSEGEARVQGLLPFITVAGVVMMVAGWTMLNLIAESLFWSFTGIFILLLGVSFLTPLVTRLMMRLVGPLTQRFLGVIGMLAPRDIVRSLSRTSVTIAALMLAVTVIIGVSIMIDSFRTTVTVWLDSILAADVYVSPAGQQFRIGGEIPADFIAEAEAMESVRSVGLQQAATVFAPVHGNIEIRASSLSPIEDVRPMYWSVGTLAEREAALADGAVMVSEVLARRLDLPLNQVSTLELVTEDGPQSFEIVGVFFDYALPEQGYVLMWLDTYRAHWPSDVSVSNVSLYLTDKALADADTIAQDLTRDYAAEYFLSVSSNRSIKENALAVFDRTFTITTALRFLATIVAFIGVLSALMSLQLERTRELGVLRANGMTVPQLWGKTMLETGLMGLTAGLMALPIGWILAYILIYYINLRSFGWSLSMYFNPTVFVLAIAVAMVAALLAGIYPVIRLSRMEIATAVREE